ncbi:MAG: DNA polymerase III subunit gamma/tau [Methylophilaceae bacterium]|nr:DNA polymerase III subunit gamma/tau [Methylophilaceae bacterium]MBL6790875.1 DNA polymerase III subunit gamma/tau [Methylophilaceae bacterium]
MSYQVLARKWRPKSFADLVGQESTVQALSNALDQNRLHHAYLFNGTRGIGKTTLARILAKSLNCEKGTSSKPCQECNTCKEIDAGRYVDLIELDAASNTGVDDMRDLLENSQYAPSSGPFKIYIIDEVHMLSKSAFNAMLKTLEEPPEHIKFILATTEPNKVPITILSRCLQFNLKQMSSENITKHLEFILTKEKIKFDLDAINIIAKAASGSMRDALSILDQAIAYNQDKIEVDKINQMLGTISNEILIRLLDAIAKQDGAGLISLTKEMNEKNISFESSLEDLARLIHELSLAKMIPNYFEGSDNKEILNSLEDAFTPENLQLLYQIATLGKRDLYLAPDLLSGFNMALLRMIAFYPSFTNNKKEKTNAVSKNESVANKEPIKSESFVEKKTPEFDGNWRKLVEKLELGMARSLAQESEFHEFKGGTFYLRLQPHHKHLSENTYQEKLEIALSNHFMHKIKVELTIAKVKTSPAIEKKTERADLFKQTEKNIMEDSFVKELINEFDAEVISSSIQPKSTGKEK